MIRIQTFSAFLQYTKKDWLQFRGVLFFIRSLKRLSAPSKKVKEASNFFRPNFKNPALNHFSEMGSPEASTVSAKIFPIVAPESISGHSFDDNDFFPVAAASIPPTAASAAAAAADKVTNVFAKRSEKSELHFGKK